MKSDAQRKKDVQAELEWDASVNAANVGVAVKEGAVTLTGHLDTFADRYQIERAALRVLAVELDVKLAANHLRSESEIAQAVESALQWHALIPADRIRFKVEKGWVTLSGEVDWDLQRRNTEKAVRNLVGVTGVTNTITLKALTSPAKVTARIRDALKRQAEREANAIQVDVIDSTATLRGQVHAWSERVAAQGAAFSAPGITRVVNELRVTQ
jgi:osmotically-inducible protein OsmY